MVKSASAHRASAFAYTIHSLPAQLSAYLFPNTLSGCPKKFVINAGCIEDGSKGMEEVKLLYRKEPSRMKWIRASKACQMNRTRSFVGVWGERTRVLRM